MSPHPIRSSVGTVAKERDPLCLLSNDLGQLCWIYGDSEVTNLTEEEFRPRILLSQQQRFLCVTLREYPLVPCRGDPRAKHSRRQLGRNMYEGSVCFIHTSAVVGLPHINKKGDGAMGGQDERTRSAKDVERIIVERTNTSIPEPRIA